MDSLYSLDSGAPFGQEFRRIAVVHRRVAIVIDQNQVSSRGFGLMNLHNMLEASRFVFSNDL